MVRHHLQPGQLLEIVYQVDDEIDWLTLCRSPKTSNYPLRDNGENAITYPNRQITMKDLLKDVDRLCVCVCPIVNYDWPIDCESH